MSKAMYVYCIATHKPAGYAGPVKIGFSENPTSRLASLRTGSPQKLGIAGALLVFGRDAASIIERQVHARFEKDRLEGEWFAIPPMDALEYMADLYTQLLHVGVANGQIEQADFEWYLWHSCVTPIREKIAAENYLRAWESLAAA